MKPAKLITLIPFLIVIGALMILFSPMARGKVPIPLDGLAGTYFPWLDYKWGYEVGVPVKNVAVSDVFSLYQWRTLALDSWRAGQPPLWNPYSFAGTPLLANWQSAPFYPGNILMYWFGDLWGWSVMVMLQPVLGLLFMYLWLKKIGLKSPAALTGAIIFALGGFMTTYLEYNTTGQILIWLPLLLWLSERYISNNKIITLSLMAVVTAIVSLGGFFQPALYVYLVWGSYFLLRAWKHKRRTKLLAGAVIAALLGLSLAAMQLLPTLELLGRSIREVDANIFEYQFGLLPLRHTLSLWAPDFFGNPVTYNFWGFMQYQETAGYFSVVALTLVLTAITAREKSFQVRFFGVIFFASLLLAFKNPLSSLVYSAKLPLLSTGYASRWLMLTGFSAAVLAAFGLDNIDHKRFLRWGLVVFAGAVLISAYTGLVSYFLTHSVAMDAFDGPTVAQNIRVAFRNSLLPLGLMFIALAGQFVFRKSWLFPILLLGLITFDLLRFSHKFTPFAPVAMAQTNMEVTDYLRENIDHFRLEKETGPLLPLNSWQNFRLMSPSGYDPLSTKDYGEWFRVLNSSGTETLTREQITEGNFTRYLEWNNYQSPFIDLAGVKYVMALRRDKDSVVSREGGQFFYSFPVKRFQKEFEYGTVAVFNNPGVMDRVSLFDQIEVIRERPEALSRLSSDFDFRRRLILDRDPENSLKLHPSDSVRITGYTPNQVEIEAVSQAPVMLMLTDSYYPGWVASVNGREVPILLANGIFRAVELPGGENKVVFQYRPKSFNHGIQVSFGALLLLGLLNLLACKLEHKWPKRK